jgi:hypothetical protein
MVDFGDDEWPMVREKVCCAAQDLELPAFYVNLDQLRHGSAMGDEVVQRDRWHSYDFAGSRYGALSVHLHATL